MAVTLKLVLGTINYVDYLRVSAAKVSDPGTEVFVQYINTPVTNYTLIIPNLDPDNYFINFRDAPDTSSLGTLVSQAFVNAMTGEFEYERRFYTIGSLPGGVTNTATVLNDPYFINKNITGVFKEGFRYLEPDTEWEFDDTTGDITLLTLEFSDQEKFIVEIKYNAGGSILASPSGLFSATITVDAATYTIDPTDKGKRFMLDCLGPTQVVTVPLLSSLAVGDFVYLEHKRSGVQAQSKIITAGTDKVLFNGFALASNELSELWLSKGQGLYLRKEGSYWEIIFDYAGVHVGERMAGSYKDQPNWLPEDGRLLDGDEYPGLFWWISNVLPSTHYIVDDTVVDGGYVHPAGKEGLFVIHSSLKKYRLPNTQDISEKGLKDFDTYGADADRVYDYPGGVQNEQVGEMANVSMNIKTGAHSSASSALTGEIRFLVNTLVSTPQNNATAVITLNSGKKQRVKNIGIIYLRRIG